MEKIVIIVAWLLVIVSGILVGGSIFERVVLSPLWAGSPPESVTAWPHGSVQAPFFMVATPTWALLSLTTFALSFVMPAEARPWARFAGAIGVGVMIWTAAFFIPLVTKTMGNRGVGLTAEEISRFTLQFVNWGHLRTILALGGWVAALRTLLIVSR